MICVFPELEEDILNPEEKCAKTRMF
jgi:hypothetical protein